jgi:hypothetical protein
VSFSLLDAGDVRAMWPRVETGGVGGVSRSSGGESERVGREKQRLDTGRALVVPIYKTLKILNPTLFSTCIIPTSY